MEHRLVAPPDARALLVLAHGAGAGMRHPFLERIAQALGERKVATYRYEFLYMEKHQGRPDPPAIAAARVRAAVLEAARAVRGVPLFAGGKSFGGRMTSQAQAGEPCPACAASCFSDSRCTHRADPVPAGLNTCRRSESRCYSFRGRATISRDSICCGPWSPLWVTERHCTW